MAVITNLPDAISSMVNDGDTVALEGFTHLIPFTAGHEIIRQQKKNLTLIRMTPDIIYDQMIGMGCAEKIIFSWAGNPGVGSLHRLRDAIENGWPNTLQIEEHSHAAMANAYDAGAAGLPMAVFRGYEGVDLEKYTTTIKRIECPFSGDKLAAIPALQPDVSIVHAQKSDRKGNVLIEGIAGVQKEAVLSAKRSIITVEEIVDELKTDANAIIIPGWAINLVAEVPLGAYPSYALGYYSRDNHFYTAWDKISRDRSQFISWMEKNILESSSDTSMEALV